MRPKAGLGFQGRSDVEQFDVVVIGAGLAGLQATRLLARRGVRVLLVDRKNSLEDAVHTTGIFVRRTLEDFDLPRDCLGPPVRRVKLYSPARREQTLVSEHDEFRVGRMGRLYARLLEECLDARATWSPATHYAGLEDACVSSVESGARGSIVLLERAGVVRRIATRFVLGGDGARSRVARDLELDENREWIVGVEDVFRGVPPEGEPCFHCFLDPRLAPGYLAWVVCDGEETHVGVGGYAARFDPARALESFRAEITRRLFDFTSARRVERRGGRIPVGGVLKRIANERGLLLGDAAGAVSPLTAGGLDPCMRLSSLAAEVVAEYLETGDAAVLARYSGARFRSRFASRLWMRRALSSIRSRSLLEAACALSRCRPFDALAQHVFFGRGSFPDVERVARAVPHTPTSAARPSA
jgi:flavin-dependent dehydrogenase